MSTPTCPVSLTGNNIGGFLCDTIVSFVPWENIARGAGREMGRSGGREVTFGAVQVEAGQELDYCWCSGNGEGERPSFKMVN